MEFVISDGGRKAAGFKGDCGDSLVRAIAIAARRPYAEVYKECSLMNANYSKTNLPKWRFAGVRTARYGVCTDHAQFRDYMKNMEFVWYPPRRWGKACKLYLDDTDIPMGRLIITLSRYWMAVDNGIIFDAWDPHNFSSRWPKPRVYGWWKLEDAKTIRNTTQVIPSEKEINRDYKNR